MSLFWVPLAPNHNDKSNHKTQILFVRFYYFSWQNTIFEDIVISSENLNLHFAFTFNKKLLNLLFVWMNGVNLMLNQLIYFIEKINKRIFFKFSLLLANDFESDCLILFACRVTLKLLWLNTSDSITGVLREFQVYRPQRTVHLLP